MKVGDVCFFYHSNEGKAVVGLAKVTREAFQDPTTKDDWSAVEIAPVAPMEKEVTLAQMKADPKLAQMAVVRKSRLSVSPVTPAEFAHVLSLGKTKLPEIALLQSATAASGVAPSKGEWACARERKYFCRLGL